VFEKSESGVGTLERLRRWPNLWRHPDVLTIVYGSKELSSMEELIAAFIQPEVIGSQDAPNEAWRRVLESGDLGAIEAAHSLISNAFPNDTDGQLKRKKEWDAHREGARRRIEIARRRFRNLDRHSAIVPANLRKASEQIVSDPAEAERALRVAVSEMEAVETSILKELRERIAAVDMPQALVERVDALVEDRNIRVARWFVDRLIKMESGAKALTIHDIQAWGFWQPPEEIIGWLLDPNRAPINFRSRYGNLFSLEGDDHLLVLKFRQILTTGSITSEAARDLFHLLISWLADVEAESRSRMQFQETQDDFFFIFRSRDFLSLTMFPQVVASESLEQIDPFVDIAIPKRFDIGPNELRATVERQSRSPCGIVAWDLFDRWRSVRTPRTLIVPFERIFQAKLCTPDVRRAFVRLSSRDDTVRRLVDGICAAPWRLRYFVSQEHLSLGGCLDDDRFDALLDDLMDAMDFIVEPKDTDVLVHAASNRVMLLIQLMGTFVSMFPSDASPSARRLEVARWINQPEVEDEVLEIIESRIEDEFGVLREGAARELSALDYVFELCTESGGPEGLVTSTAASHLFSEAAAELELTSEGQATEVIKKMLSGALLRQISLPGNIQGIVPNRTLLYSRLLAEQQS
jgi:hypothetical protein